MKFSNQSAGQKPKRVKGEAYAGCENPAKAQQVELGYSRKHTMPVAAMAGSFSRKFPEAKTAGQDVAGEKGKRGAVKTRSHSKLTKSSGGKRVNP